MSERRLASPFKGFVGLENRRHSNDMHGSRGHEVRQVPEVSTAF